MNLLGEYVMIHRHGDAPVSTGTGVLVIAGRDLGTPLNTETNITANEEFALAA